MQKNNQSIFSGRHRLLRIGSIDGTCPRLERRTAKRSGLVLLMYMSAMGAMLGFCSLAVDFGHVVTIQTEVRNVADAAGHAAAQQLTNSGTASQQIAAARAAAEQVALLNQVDGRPATLVDNDIQIGNWDTTQTPNFSTSRSPLNAAQVTVHHDSSNCNPVTMMFAESIGFSSMSVTTTITAINTNLMSPYGFAGLNSVSFGSVGVLASIQGDVVSNGTISIGEPLGVGVTVTGNAMSTGGAVGHGSLAAIAGNTGGLTSLIYPTPTAPTSNNNAQIASCLDCQQNFTTAATADIPAGTYVVHDLNFLAGVIINLHGPTTFYVSGTFNMAATINLLNLLNTDPNNLNVIVLNGGSVNFLASLVSPLAMNLYAPQTPVTIAVGVNQYTGSIIAKTLDIDLPVAGTFIEVKPGQSSSLTSLVQ